MHLVSLFLLHVVDENCAQYWSEIIYRSAFYNCINPLVAQFVLMQVGFAFFPATGQKGGLQLPSGLINSD